MSTALQQVSAWQVAHEALTRLARARAGLDFEEGQKLRAAQQARVHERLGYGSFVEYIERLFGYSPRLTLEKLRVAEALGNLPQLAEALRQGSASWSSLRELTRVATRETEHAWLEASRGRTVREFEKLVSGRQPGDLPESTKDWRVERHVLRFDVSGEVLAIFREALARLRRDAGAPLDDDAALLQMARQVLQGPSDEGRASYQIAIGLCEACARATQTGGGTPLPISSDIVKMACCDGQQVHDARPDNDGRETHVGDAVPHERSEPHTVRERKATQAIPPAARRTVLRRDHHCCQVPGCRHAIFVDVHHLRAREDGGGHEPDNLLTVCGAHHRACHRGELVIEGCVSSGLVFRHVDGTVYGQLPLPGSADAMARAFRALGKLGFGEQEARHALQEVSAHVGGRGGVETLVRAALERLTRNAWVKAS